MMTCGQCDINHITPSACRCYLAVIFEHALNASAPGAAVATIIMTIITVKKNTVILRISSDFLYVISTDILTLICGYANRESGSTGNSCTYSTCSS